MRILISRKNIRDTLSGVPKNILCQSEMFAKNGDSVYVIAEEINKPMISESGAIPVKTFRWPISGYLNRKFYQWRVQNWIKRNKPALVIGHGDIMHQDILRMHNCTHLASELIYNKPLPEDDPIGRIHAEILTNGTFKLLVCNSNMMKDDLIRRFAINPDRVCVIYPEVSLAPLDSENYAEIRSEMRAKYGIGVDEKIISLITSGNLKKRNVESALKAFAMLKTDAKLFIAKSNGQSEYINMAAELGIKDRVVFAPALKDIKAYYYMSDIFVLPAFIEEFGIAVLEAMYCRLPVVLSRYVGASEILEGQSRDFILKENTPEELAEKLNQLLSSPELMKTLGDINRATAMKYTADALQEQFCAVIKERKII